LTDLLDGIRKDIERRLAELRPAVREAEQLERALKALGEPQRRVSAQGTRRQSKRARRRVTREEAEARRQQVLAMLAEDPQTKPSALAVVFGTSRNNVYSLLRRLEQDGALSRTKDGYRVHSPKAHSGS
jgi:CRP-like cAMP-binding protein